MSTSMKTVCESPEELEREILDLMQFMTFAHKEDAAYRGTLRFKFEGGPSYSVRLGGDGATVFKDIPSDGDISCEVSMTMGDFMFVYSGKAGATDIARLCLGGRIKVSSPFKLGDVSGFANSFDFSSECWTRFYVARDNGESLGGTGEVGRSIDYFQQEAGSVLFPPMRSPPEHGVAAGTKADLSRRSRRAQISNETSAGVWPGRPVPPHLDPIHVASGMLGGVQSPLFPVLVADLQSGHWQVKILSLLQECTRLRQQGRAVSPKLPSTKLGSEWVGPYSPLGDICPGSSHPIPVSVLNILSRLVEAQAEVSWSGLPGSHFLGRNLNNNVDIEGKHQLGGDTIVANLLNDLSFELGDVVADVAKLVPPELANLRRHLMGSELAVAQCRAADNGSLVGAGGLPWDERACGGPVARVAALRLMNMEAGLDRRKRAQWDGRQGMVKLMRVLKDQEIAAARSFANGGLKGVFLWHGYPGMQQGGDDVTGKRSVSKERRGQGGRQSNLRNYSTRALSSRPTVSMRPIPSPSAPWVTETDVSDWSEIGWALRGPAPDTPARQRVRSYLAHAFASCGRRLRELASHPGELEPNEDGIVVFAETEMLGGQLPRRFVSTPPSVPWIWAGGSSADGEER
ncbi:unnamed protein product [Choristocarpus tenellus]